MDSQFPIDLAKTASRILMGLLLSAPLFAAIDVRIDLEHIENNLGSAANWNTLRNNASLNDLIDFNTGSGTSIDIANSGISNSSSSTAHWNSDKDWVADLAGDDSIGTASGTGLIEFTGLSAPLYRIEIVSSSISFDRLAILRVENNIANRTFEGNTVADPWDAFNNGQVLQDWLIWDAVAPVVGGIEITLNTGNSNTAPINAIRLFAIPEQSTYAGIFGLFILIGVMRFRKELGRAKRPR